MGNNLGLKKSRSDRKGPFLLRTTIKGNRAQKCSDIGEVSETISCVCRQDREKWDAGT